MDKNEMTDAFRRYLLENRFQDGDPLPGELELAKRFAVSRSVIRDVLTYFTQMGVLERVRNRGTTFRTVSAGRLEKELMFHFQMADFGYEELRESRLYMESALAPLIISRMDPEVLELLEKNMREQEKLIDVSDGGKAFDRLDMEFHLLLLKACRNRSLALYSCVLIRIFSDKNRSRLLTPEIRRLSYGRHKKILAAIRKRDAGLLTALLRSHIHKS